MGAAVCEERCQVSGAFVSAQPNCTFPDTANMLMHRAGIYLRRCSVRTIRYVVLTSKHHDGYALWDTKYSFSWNSMDVGPHRDLVGELANAIRANTSLVFGLYHSLFEWFHPLYKNEAANNFAENYFVTTKASTRTATCVKLMLPHTTAIYILRLNTLHRFYPK